MQEAMNAARLAETKEFRVFMGGFVVEAEAMYTELRDMETTDPNIASLQARIKAFEEIIAKPEVLMEHARTKRANAQVSQREVTGQGGDDDLLRG